jgi:single-stranded DNA-specific DHH superfamily exonuclease
MNRYIIGSQEDFHDFVNSLNKKDKIGIITHTDLDGLASGLFLEKILESRNLKIDFIEFLDYGADVLNSFLKKDVDVLFFTDWNVDNFLEPLEKLRNKFKVFVVDHHPPNENLKNKLNILKTESKYCSAHTLFDLAKEKNYFNTNDFQWLVCSAIILDYTFETDENFKFLKSVYPNIIKEEIFEIEPGKIGTKIANALIYYNPDFKKVYEFTLKKDFSSLEKADKKIREEIEKGIELFRREAEYFLEKKLYFYYGNLNYNLTSVVVSQLSHKELDKDTLIFISDMSDKKGFVKMSARNQTGEVDLGKLLKKCIEGFDDSSAGGHPKASAGSFPKRYLSEFKKRLLDNL